MHTTLSENFPKQNVLFAQLHTDSDEHWVYIKGACAYLINNNIQHYWDKENKGM